VLENLFASLPGTAAAFYNMYSLAFQIFMSTWQNQIDFLVKKFIVSSRELKNIQFFILMKNAVSQEFRFNFEAWL